MVAFSLYRGNLHKAPDAPRKWLMPRRNISLNDFKILSDKRDRTVSSIKIPSPPTTAIVFVPNPNPNLQQEEGNSGGSNNKLDSEKRDKTLSSIKIPSPPSIVSVPNPNPNLQQEEGDAGGSKNKLDSDLTQSGQEEIVDLFDGKEKEERQHLPTAGTDYSEFQIELDIHGDEQQPVEVEDNSLTVDEITGLILDIDSSENVAPAGVDGTSQGALVVSDQPTMNVVDLPSDKEKKKRELEKKLEDLNAKKHNLVQMLKQILIAEEEMKRRNNVPAIRPPAPLQVETSDLGSPRQAVTRTALDSNHCGDLEGESEDHSPHNTHIRNFQRVRSTSPSGSSPFRKTSHSSLQPSTVLCPPRTIGVIASPSPSRFAPSGSAHPANIPPAPVSVSGTQFIASSPSPAASGGTSVFRDSHFTSPS